MIQSCHGVYGYLNWFEKMKFKDGYECDMWK